MEQILFTWNETRSQARDYVASVNSTIEKKEAKRRREELHDSYKVRAEIEHAKREEFWKGYFREAV